MEENKKSKAGRKTKYSKALGMQIAEAYGLGRSNIAEICTHFLISHDTFFSWKKKFPEFSDSIAHYENIRRQNLGQMALSGLALLLEKHEFTEEKTIYETYTEDGTQKLRVVGIQKTKKFTLPNARMVEYALNNIKPEEFKNASHIDHTTKGESLSFGHFLQQTKPTASKDEAPGHTVAFEGEAEDVYIPDHREPKETEA